jgi:hypothetical protein
MDNKTATFLADKTPAAGAKDIQLARYPGEMLKHAIVWIGLVDSASVVRRCGAGDAGPARRLAYLIGCTRCKCWPDMRPGSLPDRLRQPSNWNVDFSGNIQLLVFATVRFRSFL